MQGKSGKLFSVLSVACKNKLKKDGRIGRKKEGVKIQKKDEINKPLLVVTFFTKWSDGGCVTRAFSARATAQNLIGRSVDGHLPNGRNHCLPRGNSPCTPKSPCLSNQQPLLLPPYFFTLFALSLYLQLFPANVALTFSSCLFFSFFLLTSEF